MPRRNIRAIKTKMKRRYEEPEFTMARKARNTRVIRVPLEDQVIPIGRCPSPHRKMMFETAEQAKKAMRHANIRHERFGDAHREVRVYGCPACDAWHMTSREAWENR